MIRAALVVAPLAHASEFVRVIDGDGLKINGQSARLWA